jgi:hypothetical protein
MDAFARVQKTIIFLFSIFFVIFALSFAGCLMPAEGDKYLNINTFRSRGDGPHGCGR